MMYGDVLSSYNSHRPIFSDPLLLTMAISQEIFYKLLPDYIIE